jgi:phage terminase large subunit-like protein
VLDPVAHAAANPALGTFRSQIELRAGGREGGPHAVLRKQLPQPVSEPAGQPLFALHLAQRLGRHGWEVDEEAFSATGPVYGGLDLAETTDLCAFVLIAQARTGAGTSRHGSGSRLRR